VLVTAIVMTAVMAVILASYLTLLGSRNRITMRSQAWNEALPLLEAGIEEAFTHLKDDSSLTNNGWDALNINSNLVYQKRRDFTNSGAYFVTTISNASVSPAIYSQGYVPAPLGTGYISRLVLVTTAQTGLFSRAITTRGAQTYSGDFQVNSFDSGDPNYSTNGLYVSNRFKANGDLASMSAVSNQSIRVAGSLIYGRISYPAGGGYTIGSGEVGDVAFVSNPLNTGKIESGYSNNTLNISVPDAPPPPTDPTYWAAPQQNYTWTNGVTYAYVLSNGNYTVGSATLKGTILVLGNARLYIASTGRVQFGSHDIIKIPVGGHLDMYNASTIDAVFPGIINDSGLAPNFTYWGMNTTAGSKVTLTGNGQFAGSVYAPYQDVVLTGGSSNLPRDMIGAIVANSVVSSGHFYLSYDERLGGGGGNLTLASYTEL
jgi:hypothetical protein